MLEFNDLNNKYSQALDNVFISTLATKNEMANGLSLSSIIKEGQDGVVHLLKIFDFGGDE